MYAPNWFSRFFALLLLSLQPALLLAQDSAGSAFGEYLDLSIKSTFSLVTVEAESGPLPQVSDGTPPPFNTSDTLLSVDVNASVKLISDLLPATTIGLLETGILNVETSGDASPQSDSSASVADVNLELLGTALLPLVLGIQADEVISTATASGSCDDGLIASGTTSLVNASLASDLAQLVGIEGNLAANPAPNFVLLDLNLLGGHISIILNEQILSGDGSTNRGITVNAIHITIDNLPILAIITDLTGEVIISQSQASVTCAEADISVAISDSPDPVTAGNALTYTLTVENDGPDNASNVMVEHLLPAGVAFVSANPAQGSCNQAAGTVTCNLGTINSGGSTSITVIVTPSVPGQLSSTATVSTDDYDPDLSNNTDSENTTVNAAPGSADLSVLISDSPDPVTAGQPLTITLDVLNDGPNAATDTVVVYKVPSGVTVTDVTPSQGNCVVTTTTITCNLGTVPDNGTPDIIIEMIPPIPGTLLHEASVSSSVSDPTPGNNDDTEQTNVESVPDASADLSLVKTDDPDPVKVGQLLTYTLTVSNNGPDNTTSVVVTDTLPASAEFVSAVPSQGNCNYAEPVVTCNLGPLADDDSATITIVVVPQEAGEITNTAVTASDVDDPDLSDNEDEEETTVDPGEADLSITKDSSVNPGFVGVPFEYTLTIANNGPDNATQVVVVDTLPASVEFGSALPSQGNCEENSGVITCELGTISDQGDATVVIEVTPTQLGTLVNVASVESQVEDPDNDDNTVTHTMEVVESDRTTFLVTKEFTDGDNPTEVEVTINCFTGLPIEQSQSITEVESVEFVVTSFASGELDCEITEENLVGYTPTYHPGGPGEHNATGGCNFEDVLGGSENTCHIVNDADYVSIEIEKLWVIEGSGGDQTDTNYKLTLHCNAPIESGDQYCHGGGQESSAGGNGGGYQYCKKFYGNNSNVFTAEVQPEYPTSHCWVDERVFDNSVEIENGCGDIVISAGHGNNCLITNSVFFEGIPSLDPRGLVVLMLLLLGFGMYAARRVAG